jgi:hypothetical protein
MRCGEDVACLQSSPTVRIKSFTLRVLVIDTNCSSSKVNEEEFASFFWQILSKILPEAKRNPQNSEQLFQASLAIFRSVGEFSRDRLDLEGYIIEWGTLLVTHKHEEVSSWT